MVVFDDIRRILQPFRAFDDIDPVVDVMFHLLEFFRAQLAGLQQYGVADADFTHIVEKGALYQTADGTALKGNRLSQVDGVDGDAVVVAVRSAVSFGHRPSENLQHFHIGFD